MNVAGGVTWTRVRVPRLLSYAAKALVVALLLSSQASFVPGIYLGFFFVPLLVASYFLSLVPKSGAGGVEVHPRYIVVRSPRPRMVARSSIVGALVVEPLPGATLRNVELELADGDRIAVQTSDPSQASALVEALGFGPSGRRVTMTVTQPSARFMHLPMGAIATVLSTLLASIPAAIFDHHGGEIVLMAWALLTPVIYELIVRRMRGPIVTVGDDLVRVTRGTKTRDLPVDERAVAEIQGSSLDVPRKAALAKLVAARAAARRPPPERAPMLAREGTPVAAWRDRIAAALDGGTYRGAPLTVDEALAVLDSTGAPADARVGAAMALRVAGQEEAIRVAADRTADDRVRVALEAALEGDDAEVEKAMRRIA